MDTQIYIKESVAQRCSGKTLFSDILQISRKPPLRQSIFNQKQALAFCCSLIKVAKSFGTAFIEHIGFLFVIID